ncbi:MAG: sugar ABC transporter permease [Treponema sp.]|nr:sugar ABC transporter permease [Treponema sp.]MBQ7618923.1 sugar ABC transporter permease [Treponema sp.]
MAKELPTDGSALKKIKVASRCFMGLSHLLYLREYVKGSLFAALEILFICLLPTSVTKIIQMITLGDPHPELPVRQRDNSVFMLIDGMLFLSLIAIFAIVYVISVKSAEKSYKKYCALKRFSDQKNALQELAGSSFTVLGLAPAVVMLIIFVVVPLVFSVAVAFTNYSAPDHISPGNTVDWVGFSNFKTLLSGGTNWSVGFGRVALWTVIWAFGATFTCYFGGLIIAVMLNEAKIKFGSIFRVIFILPYAVPAVITMITWRNLLNGTFGTVNRTLMALGLISQPIPWLGSPVLAQIMCIVINLWAGFGYFMMLSMGSMTAISGDLYEAARIDGASSGQVLRKITLPLVLYQTMPQIIMSFTHNLNNFGIIFFLTGGAPTAKDSSTTLAGSTDILVTWIYKLTITLLKYHYASVIAVLIFVVMAPFAIFLFRNTRSYKEGHL